MGDRHQQALGERQRKQTKIITDYEQDNQKD